jgi:Domain of unknown function (DUF3492)
VNTTLITEGTYPYHPGGVSVWCDQRVCEFPEHQYQVFALGAKGDEKCTRELPDNIVSLDVFSRAEQLYAEVQLWAAPASDLRTVGAVRGPSPLRVLRARVGCDP